MELSKTIMIAEDVQIFHDLYTELLEDTDYRLIHAYDGDEALLELEKEKPDLIILDMAMDMMTGDTFLLYLKSMSECKDIPVIVSSVFSQNDYKNLKEIDPKLVYIEKYKLTKEKLFEEVEKRLQ